MGGKESAIQHLAAGTLAVISDIPTTSDDCECVRGHCLKDPAWVDQWSIQPSVQGACTQELMGDSDQKLLI